MNIGWIVMHVTYIDGSEIPKKILNIVNINMIGKTKSKAIKLWDNVDFYLIPYRLSRKRKRLKTKCFRVQIKYPDLLKALKNTQLEIEH